MQSASRKLHRHCDSFENDVLQHREVLFRRALNLTKNRSAAEDLVQDTLLRAFMSRDSFTYGNDLRPWLFTIMRNRFLSGKRKKKELGIENMDWVAAIPDDSSYLDVREESDEIEHDFEIVLHVMASLPDISVDAFVLHHYEGHQYDVVASELGMVLGTVKSRINRCQALLAKQLAAGKIVTTDVESWLSQKILCAHHDDKTLLAKTYEQILERYLRVRVRIIPPTTSTKPSVSLLVPLPESDAGIEDLFDDF